MRVVNDTAERGVKLFEEYNSLLTNDEEEKQFLLQVVEANRKAVPTEITKKSAIVAMLEKLSFARHISGTSFDLRFIVETASMQQIAWLT